MFIATPKSSVCRETRAKSENCQKKHEQIIVEHTFWRRIFDSIKHLNHLLYLFPEFEKNGKLIEWLHG